MDTAAKTGLDSAKTTSKKVVHKTAETAEVTGVLRENATAKIFLIVKPKPVPDENSINDDEEVIASEKRQKILTKLREAL